MRRREGGIETKRGSAPKRGNRTWREEQASENLLTQPRGLPLAAEGLPNTPDTPQALETEGGAREAEQGRELAVRVLLALLACMGTSRTKKLPHLGLCSRAMPGALWWS